ncbi:hypothetical protein Tco_0646002 [Tanacetum coccineum]
MKLDQFAQFCFNSLTEEEGWNRIRGTSKNGLQTNSYLETPTREIGLKNPFLICDFYGGAHEADECSQNNPTEQVYLSGGDIYNDPSVLRFYQKNDIPPWGNSKRKEKREDGPKWVVRNKFEYELASFMLEKKFHTKGIGEMSDQHRKEMHKQFSQILFTIGESKFPEPEAPTFAITTRSEISTQDPPFPTLLQSTPTNYTEGTTERKGPEGAESSTMQNEEAPLVIHFLSTLQVIISAFSIQSKEAEEG